MYLNMCEIQVCSHVHVGNEGKIDKNILMLYIYIYIYTHTLQRQWHYFMMCTALTNITISSRKEQHHQIISISLLIMYVNYQLLLLPYFSSLYIHNKQKPQQSTQGLP